MYLGELRDQLLPVFPPSMQKDVKTAVGYLAKALDCSDPQHCPPELYNQPLAALYHHIEDYHLAHGKGPHTIRNTKNAISRLFREAAHYHLFSLTPRTITQRYSLHAKPKRAGSSTNRQNGTYLPHSDWPPDLQESFTAFATWATAPVIPGRNASFRKRPVTIGKYKNQFQAYYGFLMRVQHVSPLTFDQLFDFSLVSNYVHWHVNDIHGRPTEFIHSFLNSLLALTRQYRPDPDLRTQLTLLKKTLPKPSPVFHKEEAWVPLAILDEVGRALWPRRSLTAILQHDPRRKHAGLVNAVHAGASLMLRLWTYRPYRQRNMREMQLGDNLYKDAHGTWRITFRGEQLKVATKRGRPNVFDLPFPQTLIPVLEEYLNVWRPLLLSKASQPSSHVFLTRYGNPYQVNNLSYSISNMVYRYTGKRWHPHIIRTVWATEWIRKTHGDFYTAAIMLNDTIEIVIKKYSQLLEDDVAEKADRLIEERNGQGK